MALFATNDAVLPLRQALDRVDTQLDLLTYALARFRKPPENLPLSDTSQLR
jgi:hypothetical protein